MAETNNVKSNNYIGVLLLKLTALDRLPGCRPFSINTLPITAIMLNNESKVQRSFEALEAYNSFRGFFVYRPPTPQNAHLCTYVCGCGKCRGGFSKNVELFICPPAKSRKGNGSLLLNTKELETISGPAIIMELFKRNGSEHPLLKVKTGKVPLEEGPGNSASRFL